MKQKIIETTKARLLIVDLPEGHFDFFVMGGFLWKRHNEYTIENSVANATKLPPGNWQLLGKPEDVSVDDMVSVLGGQFCNYCSLEKKGGYGAPGGYVAGCEGSRCSNTEDTIRERFNELLESEISLVNPIGERPVCDCYNTCGEADRYNCGYDQHLWQRAEEKVFRNPILLMEVR